MNHAKLVNLFTQAQRYFFTFGRKFWRSTLPLFLCLLFLTTGCVEYDLGINFVSQTQGEIVQHIQLGERLTSFSQDAKNWLNTVENRVKQLQGHSQRKSDGEITVIIPFNNGRDLANKFNQFFKPNELENSQGDSVNELVNFDANLDLVQNNFFLFIRNQMNLNLDLRSVSLLPDPNNSLVGSESLFNLNFRLTTPWGAKVLQATVEDTTTGTPTPTEAAQLAEQQLTWKLQPGTINSLEVVFWVPSPIGIGALIIILFVAGGIYLKYQLLPALGIGKNRKTVAGAG